MNQNSNNYETSTPSQDNDFSKKRELHLIRHTETIDKLVLQNKNLQKEIDDADHKIELLKGKLQDHSVRISKNILYTILIVAGILAWSLIGKINGMNEVLIETKIVLQEYKHEIDKTKMYNQIIKEKNIN